MAMVGEFPGLNRGGTRIRSIRNNLDKSTVVSIYPKEIYEVKCTLQPGEFHLSPGSLDIPAILVVGASSWFREFPDDQPTLEIPVSSVQVADSIVRDYCNGMLGCDMDTAIPGLFFIPGTIDIKEIKAKYNGKLMETNEKQNNWFRNLVKLADSLWSRSNGNPLAISEEMRIAAKMLNYNEKDWLKDYKVDEMVRCFACGNLRNPKYPVCATCKAIDPNHPLAKEVKFA